MINWIAHILKNKTRLKYLYTAVPGNKWDTDPLTGVSGLGIGPQEQFYGCADVAVRRPLHKTTRVPDLTDATMTPTPGTTTTVRSSPTSTPMSSSASSFQPTSLPTSLLPPSTTEGTKRRCYAIGMGQGNPDWDIWCDNNCAQLYCPPTHCKCDYEIQKVLKKAPWILFTQN